MRAACPTCSCVVWVADDEVVDRAIDITCPSCGVCFSVRDCDDQANAGSGDPISSFFDNDSDTVKQLGELQQDMAKQSSRRPKPQEEYPDSLLNDPSVVEAEKSLTDSILSKPNDSAQVNSSKLTTGVSAIRAQSGFKKDLMTQDSVLKNAVSIGEARSEYDSKKLAESVSLRTWKMLAALSSLLVLVILCVTLTRYGVVDLSFGLYQQNVNDANSHQIETWLDTNVQTFQSENPEDVFMQSISAGKQALLAKRYSRAALEFNRALSVKPSSSEALQGLAKAYYGLGDLEKVTSLEVEDVERK